MATRLYLPSTGSPTISPAIDAGWNQNLTGGTERVKAVTAKIGSAVAQQTWSTSGTFGPNAGFLKQVIYGPIGAQSISGTVTVNIKASENTSAGSVETALGVRILDSTGAVRATCFAVANSTGSHSWSGTTYASETWAETLTAQSALNGDFICIEIGYHGGGSSSSGPNQHLRLEIGDNAGSDLVGDADTTGDAWIEFSMDIVAASTGTPNQLMMMGCGT